MKTLLLGSFHNTSQPDYLHSEISVRHLPHDTLEWTVLAIKGAKKARQFVSKNAASSMSLRDASVGSFALLDASAQVTI